MVLIEEGSYSEDLDYAFSSAVRIIANNVTLLYGCPSHSSAE
jgi:hypothetical protein